MTLNDELLLRDWWLIQTDFHNSFWIDNALKFKSFSHLFPFLMLHLFLCPLLSEEFSNCLHCLTLDERLFIYLFRFEVGECFLSLRIPALDSLLDIFDHFWFSWPFFNTTSDTFCKSRVTAQVNDSQTWSSSENLANKLYGCWIQTSALKS